MPVTLRDVEHIAMLARLRFSEAEKEKFTHELNRILAAMEKLNELDTSSVAPLAHVVDLAPLLRGDRVQPSLDRGEAVKNAPSVRDGFFSVPRVPGERD
jgi:aspartyl-tRNA(Asn)/glutamyl-tRNA(Gln) amidotransferase subunit C